ncbi:STAS domain-containing protein [Geomicrobium sp. JCM 19039]|uniref:STAS domain-containing protein n=1 Tax=Geomicrobium sp. JCM 19039 TaxID=1460636 RepID=UPI00045F1FF0|nr:STAS domain-containing protein [Geomicrobium sp. JCM 19039]GAK13547.1 RsbR, positive regulator of sigma-B [Geomicrobium sp. JCM 19039]
MIKSQELLSPIMDEILRRKFELSEMPEQHSNISDSTQEMQLTPWRVKLIEVYAESIVSEPEESKEAIQSWGTQVANVLVQLQLPLDVGLHEIAYYRSVISEIIRDEAKKQAITLDDFYDIVYQFSQVMDSAVLIVSRAYMRDYHRSIESAKYAIDELSVPVVQLTKDTGVIPIIGEIDTNRAQYLMTNALEKGSEMQLRRIILDLSGVSIIDTMVAGQMFKVMNSLKLIGVEVVLSGVRPEVAQTMVNLGITVEQKVYSSLRAVIEDKQLMI